MSGTVRRTEPSSIRFFRRTLSASIYQLLTNLLALFQRQVRMDVDMLQKLIRWILNDTTIRARTRIPVAYLSKPDHNLSRAAISCTCPSSLLPDLHRFARSPRCTTIAQCVFRSHAQRSIHSEIRAVRLNKNDVHLAL